MRPIYQVGQKFVIPGLGDRLEVTGVTRYRVYYRITLVSGGMEYSARYTFETFPATLGKSEFGKALLGNRFERVDSDWRPLMPNVPLAKSSWGEA